MVAAFWDVGQFQNGGALRSIDGGSSWSVSSTGLPEFVRGMALCNAPDDLDTFYMADGDVHAGGGGVFKTTDAGLSWASTGYVSTGTFDIVCDPSDAQVLYVMRRFNQNLPVEVFRSVDRGATFSPFDNGLEAVGAGRDLAFSSSAPTLLLATATGAYVECQQFGDGDCDGDVDLFDYNAYLACVTGPAGEELLPGCEVFDSDGDDDVDFADFDAFMQNFTGSS